MAIITISRKIASYGDETARELAQLLGYTFIDKKILEKALIAHGLSQEHLKCYDERKPGFWASLSRNRDQYLDYLRETVYEYADKGSCIFIGRGGFAVLKNIPGCYAVRLIASNDTRIARLRNEFNFSEKKARLLMNESDTNRDGFHKCFFDMEYGNPVHYHLVVNTDTASPKTAANIIKHACFATVSTAEEKAGAARIRQLLLGQKIVNAIAFTHGLQIYFLDAEVSEKSIALYGVADSAAGIDKALHIASEMAPKGISVASQISLVTGYKHYP